MGWASEQFWRNLADIGIRPNVLDKRPEIEVGKIYQNRNGKWYLCKSIAGEKVTMERTTDHWTLVAHGIRLYEDGTIEWNYSTGGHWKEENRCPTCAEHENCPAAGTGVISPCPYYKEDLNYGTKE